MRFISKILDVIFPMPPMEGRVYKPILNNWLDMVTVDMVKSMDCSDMYIWGRAWRGIYFLSIVLGGVAYVLSYLYTFYSPLSNSSIVLEDSDLKGMIKVFAHLIDYVGAFVVLSLVYFFLYFLRYVDFKRYNLLRFGSHKNSINTITKHTIFVAFPFTLIVAIILPMNLSYAIEILWVFNGAVNTPLGVFIVYLITTYCMAVATYMFFHLYLELVYIFYIKIKKKRKTGKLNDNK